MLPYRKKIFSIKIFKKYFYTIFLAVFLIFSFSCSRKGAEDRIRDFSPQYEAEAAERVYYRGTGFNPDGPPGTEGETPPAFKDLEGMAGNYAMVSASGVPVQLAQQQVRKKILSGGCTIRTTSFAAGILEVSGIAEKYNGWVDSSSDNRITIRVPAENFRKAFDEILHAKDVVDKYEEADDVTDYYADLSARLEVLRNTRQRLENLLASETDTEKKVPILREIKRVDDQIEKIRADLEYLNRAIAYSTITVNFVSYSYALPYDIGMVFGWVDSLDPFSVTLPNIFRKVTVPLSEDFAVLKKRGLRYFHAETAEGTILRIGTAKNNPEGDSSFWRRAIIHTVGPRFSEYIEAEAGDVKYVIFKPKGGMDYRYLVGTVIKRKLIYVVEVYFPDSNNYEKWMDSINESLEELKIR